MSLEPRIMHGPKVEFNLSEVNLAAYLMKGLKEKSNRIVQVNAETEEAVSAAEMLQRALSVAKELKARGIKKGDVVLTALDNCLEYTYIFLGAVYIGAIFSPINPNLSTTDVKHLLKLLSPRMVFCVPRVVDTVRQGVAQDVPVVVPQHLGAMSAFLSHKNFDGVECDRDHQGDATAVIMCSSGTTGAPKGVELAHRNIQAVVAMSGLESLKTMETPPVHIMVSPGFWMSGFFSTIICLYSHLKHVIMVAFDVEKLLTNIEKYQCNILALSPFQIVQIAKHPKVEEYDLSSLFMISYAGAPLSLAMKEMAEERMQKQLMQYYGLTECLFTVVPGPDNTEKPGTVGVCAPNTSMKIVDVDTGRTLGPNTEGEICFKGPNVFKGYYRNPEATAEMIDRDGWLHTGDIGYYDEDGYLFVHDRIKELIKQKGIQVIPADVEMVLLTHPAVKDSAVVGIEHDTEQEQAIGFVVKQPGSKITEKDLVNLVKEQLPEYKWLNGGVMFVETIPRTASGKIMRRVLRQRARALRDHPETRGPSVNKTSARTSNRNHDGSPSTERKVHHNHQRLSDDFMKTAPGRHHRSRL